ncbi:hypothetical protein Fmac_025223 [Flemingia macrophylla]|uniref:FF domain-containing protein n=1 Tax=Flemingia macrophylla TaxID=520843 RepID=A0ABD1LTB7_9FABA
MSVEWRIGSLRIRGPKGFEWCGADDFFKKRKRLADDFFHLLYSTKDITVSSKWEDCRPLVEDSQEYRFIGDESLCREIFEEYSAQLIEEAKESERKRKEERVLILFVACVSKIYAWHSFSLANNKLDMKCKFSADIG